MKKGFTLIELLVVVLIIGILSSVALPQYTKSVEKARSAEAVTLLGNLANAEQIYAMNGNGYTSDLSNLDIEIPTTTKNFVISVLSADSSGFSALATRANNGTAATGSNAYGLGISISNGVVTRTCCGTQSICKAMKSGNDWSYSGATCTEVPDAGDNSGSGSDNGSGGSSGSVCGGYNFC